MNKKVRCIRRLAFTRAKKMDMINILNQIRQRRNRNLDLLLKE